MRGNEAGADTVERPDDNATPGGGSSDERTAIVRELGTSMWSAIERALASDIAVGRYTPGQQLPTEQTLAACFGVNRHTVRQAVARLASRGVVRVAHGRGTFVAEWAIDYVLGRRTRFTENLAAIGLRGRHRVLETREMAASARIAQLLAVTEGSPLTVVVTAGEAEGRTVSVSEHYFPPRLAGIADAIAREGSISRALAACGVTDYTRRRSEITARLPDTETACRLGQPETRPVLCVEGLNTDPAGLPVEFGRSFFGGDQVQLIVEADRLD